MSTAATEALNKCREILSATKREERDQEIGDRFRALQLRILRLGGAMESVRVEAVRRVGHVRIG